MDFRIPREKCVYAMSRDNEAVMSVRPGSVVLFETHDCFQGQITDESQSFDSLNWDHINPATGPLFVEGAEPGDILKVVVRDIQFDSPGVMAAIPGAGLVGDEVDKSSIKLIPLRDGRLVFREGLELEPKPMIGVIGVAPQGDPVPCGTPGKHGGNMDNAKIAVGTTLYFPVNTPGALLALGDLHAVMGDGEIMVTGVEVAGCVEVQVDIVKGKTIDNPMMEDAECVYTIASDEELMGAVKTATKEMLGYIRDRLGLSFSEAGMLLSAVGNVEVCQVVDPKLTVRFAFPKHILGTGLRFD